MSPPGAASAAGAGAETSPPLPKASGPENQSPPHSETTPLLGAHQQDEGRDEHEHEQAAPREPPQSEPAKRTKSWWLWRALWTVLGALVLAFFIKGWIEAEDVEVRLADGLGLVLAGDVG